MKGLTFRARYVPLILEGAKTSTIRRPSNRLPGPGERVRLVCRYDQPPFALATVTEVRDVTADQLTADDARLDGFASLGHLRDALAQHCAEGPDSPPVPLLLLPLPLRIIRFALDATL